MGTPSRKFVNMDIEANVITELMENNQGHKSVNTKIPWKNFFKIGHN